MSGLFDQVVNYSPPSLTSGQVNYDGTWDASTNTPTLVNPPNASSKGDYYVVSVAGTQFSLSFAVGDWIISNGTAWEKVDLTDSVSSVFGRTGAVVGVSTDYSGVGLTNTAIGAANPSTGAFTSVAALSDSGYQAVVGQLTTGDRVGISGQASGSGAALVFFDNAQTTFRPAIFDASSHSIKINGVEKASVTSTGLQGAIGATTASTGAFTTVSATTPIAINSGGTGQSTYTDGQLLIGNTSTGGLTKSTLTAGSNITITNAGGAITIASTSGGAVSSVTGTANEITSSPTTGAVVVSLPAALTFTGKTVTGGTFSSPTLTTPDLGTPSAAVLTSATGLPLTTGVTGTLPVANGGTGVTTSTGTTNVVLSGSPTIVTPVIAQINDASGNETLKLASIASAVNEVTIENAATGNAVHISATGGDASIGLHLAGKGASGYVNVQDSVDATKRLMFNASGGTTNTRTMLSSTQTVDRTISLPDATDTLVGKATTDTLTNKTLTSPTLTTPVLGTPSSGTLTSCTGLPISTGVSGLGTGIATALAVNVGTAGAPVVNGGALGTPSGGTVTNLTGTASININGTVGATTPTTVAATTLSASGASTFTNSAPSVIGGLGFRNRIINGDMRIDQRNEGAAFTLNNSLNYIMDRWSAVTQTNSTGTLQRVADAPSGFINSAKYTVSTAQAPTSGQFNQFETKIEGFNVADFGFGTASAKTVTLSFWVKSSLTGTFGVIIDNSPGSIRNYLGQYTINSANTWELKSIVIPGDTSGTWVTSNAAGLRVVFDLGCGSSQEGTANVWSTSNFRRVSGNVTLINNTAATWYLTGVQLEVGNAATEFERAPFGQQLALCQRYFCKSFLSGTKPANAVGSNTGEDSFAAPTASTGTQRLRSIFPVSMRAAPTVTIFNPVNANSEVNDLTAVGDCSSTSNGNVSERACNVSCVGNASTLQGNSLRYHFTATAEL